MSARILVVDDDPHIRESLVEEYAAAGYEPLSAGIVDEAIAMVRHQQPDLVVTDLAMPGADGFALIGAIRREHQTPIIVVSVRGSDHDKVRALDLGADDYVTKPFSVAELLARTRAQLRRTGGSGVLRFDDLTIELEHRRISQGGKEVRLTPTEFAILQFLAIHAGKPLTLDRIIARVWGAGGATRDSVRVHMGSLRRKIEPDPANPRYIVTEPWIGYRFIAEPL
ncbi:MAG TPA: response regulator transcription factor [Thermoanaerobaculia bacterium]|nr:response regulator transcription factor [Thermoanaerobaculia bacterium]